MRSRLRHSPPRTAAASVHPPPTHQSAVRSRCWLMCSALPCVEGGKLPAIFVRLAGSVKSSETTCACIGNVMRVLANFSWTRQADQDVCGSSLFARSAICSDWRSRTGRLPLNALTSPLCSAGARVNARQRIYTSLPSLYVHLQSIAMPCRTSRCVAFVVLILNCV